MKAYFPVVIVSALFLFAGCKSKNNPAPTPALSAAYLPVTSGSSWTYKDDVSSENGNIITTMTGSTATFNGKTYYAATTVSEKDGTTTSYFYEGDHAYVTRGSNFISGVPIEVQLANDNAAVGYTWITEPTDDGLVSGLAAKTVNTIKEKDITKVVNGKTFNNVIHTQVNFQLNDQSNAIYDIYLAKGVGLIQQDTHAYGLLVSSQTITGYTIK